MKLPLLLNFSRQIAFTLVLVTTNVAAQSVPQQTEGQNRSALQGMTLEQWQKMALANNPTLAQAQTFVTGARGLARQAGLWPNPTVGYVAEEIRGGSFGGGQHGVFVQQNLILGGKLGLDRKIRAEEAK